MTWSVVQNEDDFLSSKPVFFRELEDGTQQSCFAEYEPFQQWLRDNAGNLPADIQAKVEAGELTIEEAGE